MLGGWEVFRSPLSVFCPFGLGRCLSHAYYSSSNVVWRKRTTLRKKTGNVDLKMVPKIWTPFWRPRKEKTIRRTPKRGPDFAPHFRVHIAHVFRGVTPEKITCCVEDLWAGSLSWQPHVLALRRTVLRGLVFGTLFSPHFGVQRTSFFQKKRFWSLCLA